MKLMFRKILAIIGPGLFLIGYNIGTGSVTTMASAGSRWGMSLTWTVILSVIFTYIGIWAFGHYTMATGETILYAIKSRLPFGKQVAYFIITAIIIAEFVGITGLMSIVVDLLQEWIHFATGYNSEVIKLTITISLASILLVILLRGKYQFLENVLAILVAFMGISFIATAFFLVPSWSEILKGLLPVIPKEPDSALIIAGMSGTTFSSAILYVRSITIKEKGLTVTDSKKLRTDTIITVFAMFVISIAVMICAAGTLYVIGKPIYDTVDMVRILEPLAGKYAITIFIVGIVGAGVSSLIPTILIAPWVISDLKKTKLDPGSKISRIFVGLGVLIALIGPYIKTKPVSLMIITMALLAIILPLSTIAITVLLNQKYLREQKNIFWMNSALIATNIFAFAMAYYGLIGILEFFSR